MALSPGVIVMALLAGLVSGAGLAAQDAISLRQVAVIPQVPGLDWPPADVALQGEDIYVLDGARWRVVRLSAPDGRHVQTFGHARSGRSCGRFLRPAEVAVSENGQVAVWDAGDRSLTVFSPEGACLNRVATDVLEVVFDLHFVGATLVLTGAGDEGEFVEVDLSMDGRILQARNHPQTSFSPGFPDDLETCGGGGSSFPSLAARLVRAVPNRARLFHCRLSTNASIYVEYIEASDRTNLFVIDDHTDDVAAASIGIPLWFYDADTASGRLVAVRQILEPDLVIYEVH